MKQNCDDKSFMLIANSLHLNTYLFRNFFSKNYDKVVNEQYEIKKRE